MEAESVDIYGGTNTAAAEYPTRLQLYDPVDVLIYRYGDRPVTVDIRRTPQEKEQVVKQDVQNIEKVVKEGDIIKVLGFELFSVRKRFIIKIKHDEEIKYVYPNYWILDWIKKSAQLQGGRSRKITYSVFTLCLLDRRSWLRIKTRSVTKKSLHSRKSKSDHPASETLEFYFLSKFLSVLKHGKRKCTNLQDCT